MSPYLNGLSVPERIRPLASADVTGDGLITLPSRRTSGQRGRSASTDMVRHDRTYVEAMAPRRERWKSRAREQALASGRSHQARHPATAGDGARLPDPPDHAHCSAHRASTRRAGALEGGGAGGPKNTLGGWMARVLACRRKTLGVHTIRRCLGGHSWYVVARPPAHARCRAVGVSSVVGDRQD